MRFFGNYYLLSSFVSTLLALGATLWVAFSDLGKTPPGAVIFGVALAAFALCLLNGLAYSLLAWHKWGMGRPAQFVAWFHIALVVVYGLLMLYSLLTNR